MSIEEQKKSLSDALNTILNKNILKNKTTYSKYSRWLNDFYHKYINNSLPEKFKEILEDKLKKRNITIEEFLETEGNLDSFITLYTNKKDPNKKNSPEEKIKTLKIENQKLTNEKEAIRLKAAETINNLSQEIKDKNKEIGNLNSKIDRQNKQIELHDTKYEKLKNEKDIKDLEIKKLNSVIKEHDKTIVSLNKKITSFQNEIEEKNLEIKKRENEIAKNKDTQKIRTIRKKHLLKLLCTNDTITLQEIKDSLISSNIPTEGLLYTLNELRYEIPGIIQNIDENGKNKLYAIQGKATTRLKELKSMNFCPSLSNIYDGKIECILIADYHLKENSLDSMKRKLEPCFNLSSSNKNIPIINFGDNQDSIRHMQKNKNLSDKDVIKYTYTFWENYAKAIATCPKTENFTEFGNHEEEAFFIGIDPLEIINNNCNNFTFLGINQGAIKVGNDKIGIYHKHPSLQGNYNAKEAYNYICREAKNIIKDNIYFFMGHLHMCRHNPLLGFSLIGNGLENSLYCTIEVKDGSVEKIYLNRLILLDNNKLFIDDSQIEVYNKSSFQYIKE